MKCWRQLERSSQRLERRTPLQNQEAVLHNLPEPLTESATEPLIPGFKRFVSRFGVANRGIAKKGSWQRLANHSIATYALFQRERGLHVGNIPHAKDRRVSFRSAGQSTCQGAHQRPTYGTVERSPGVKSEGKGDYGYNLFSANHPRSQVPRIMQANCQRDEAAASAGRRHRRL
jgi:hypothetical protein